MLVCVCVCAEGAGGGWGGVGGGQTETEIRRLQEDDERLSFVVVLVYNVHMKRRPLSSAPLTACKSI